MAVPRSGIPAPDPAPQDAIVDDLTAATLTVTGASTLATVTATSVSAPHSGLTGVTADQHHAQSHGHTGADGSGTVAHSATTGQTANDHHSQAHVVTGADHTASGLTAGHVLRATGATTFAFGALADADVPATIARDTEVTTAISDHAALADPHTGYQLESEKGIANGYASLDGAIKVPIAQVPTGTTSSTVSIGNHAHTAVGCGLYHNTTQATTASVEVALQFNAEDWDSDGFHDIATNNTRVTIPAGKDGKYRFRAFVYSGVTDVKQLRWRKNGTTFIRGTNVFNNAASIEASVTCNLAAGDYVEAMFTNGTTANIGHASAPEAQTTLVAEYQGA